MSSERLSPENVTNNLRLVSIKDLCGNERVSPYHFIIPSYQRGYRWEKPQVEDLLNDLWDFYESNYRKAPPNDGYYCLQPIIVKPTGNPKEYIVIDGQQRLTTIFILLKTLQEESKIFKLFRLKFERDAQRIETGRKTRQRYIETLHKHQLGEEPVLPEEGDLLDFRHFRQAYEIICNWFTDKALDLSIPTLEHDFLSNILFEYTKFIWYELEQDENDETAQKTFANINSGKIPLTDSELIKAVYLSDNQHRGKNDALFELEQGCIARLWDEIEKTLQNDEFWAFIGGEHTEEYATRIDHLFDLTLDEWSREEEFPNAENKLKRRFDEAINAETKEAVEKEKKKKWEEIRKHYRWFCDWHDTVILHNYIGYIISNTDKKQYKKGIKEIAEEWNRNTNTKPDFILQLQKRIGQLLKRTTADKIIDENKNFDPKKIQGLDYDTGGVIVQRLLLAHNIVSANRRKIRFNFFALGNWSIEHVFAQNSEMIDKKDRGDWIARRREIAEGDSELADIAKKIADCDIDDDVKFKSLFDTVVRRIEHNDPAAIHELSNLALLDKNLNSSLSNKAFRQKRQAVIKWIKEGKALPPSTIDVFMKSYSGCDPNLFYWCEKDGEAYVRDIIESIRIFE